ncbi:exodeoxyribonuclease VII large subunit [bacterium]
MIRKNNDKNFYGDLFDNLEEKSEPEFEQVDFDKYNKDRIIYKVSEINNLVKNLLENNFGEIWIQGEISNAKLHSSGHFYFSLKDENSQIKGIMFSYLYNYIKFKPENGLKVLVKGKLSCFVKGGTYQINATYMEPLGIGSLQLAFQQLKEKLANEGLFDTEHKKKLPLLPQKIGIITSPTGAAIRDILSVIKRRYANIEVLIYPARVQGEEAKNEISCGIKYLNKNYPDLDVMLIGRGGGSMEDLWAFNEEIVARAIFESEIPIISCVGHEVDFVISDFVADLRAPTPSSAAELVVRDKTELKTRINYNKNKLKHITLNIFNNAYKKLELIKKERFLKDPYYLFNEHSQKLDYLTEKLTNSIKLILDKKAYKLGFLKGKMESLRAENVIKRGFGIIRDQDEKILNSIKKIKKHAKILVDMKDGRLFCEVLEKQKK